MNKYKVIYYVVAIALLISVFLLIGIDLSWFSPYQSDQFCLGLLCPHPSNLTGLKRNPKI